MCITDVAIVGTLLLIKRAGNVHRFVCSRFTYLVAEILNITHWVGCPLTLVNVLTKPLMSSNPSNAPYQNIPMEGLYDIFIGPLEQT